MNVTVHTVEYDRVGLEIDLDHGRTYLTLLVSRPPIDDPETRFKRTFHARIKTVGPRGGHRGEPKTIGYGTLDLREEVRSVVTGR